MNINYPTLDTICHYLAQTGMSKLHISELINANYFHVSTNKQCAFGAYERLVALCKEKFPGKDWSYPSWDFIIDYLRQFNCRELSEFAEKAGLSFSTCYKITQLTGAHTYYTYSLILEAIAKCTN